MLVEPWAILEKVDASMQDYIRSSGSHVDARLREQALDVAALETHILEYMAHLLRKAKCAPLHSLNPQP